MGVYTLLTLQNDVSCTLAGIRCPLCLDAAQPTVPTTNIQHPPVDKTPLRDLRAVVLHTTAPRSLAHLYTWQ